MSVPPRGHLTELLRAWKHGDDDAAEALVPLVYAELRKIAANRLRSERGDHTLQPTALVHEAWLRLMRQHDVDWQNRAQFYAIAARVMRRILVDHARRRLASKRGDGAAMQDLDAIADLVASPMPDDRLMSLNDALDRLATLDLRQAQVVELRFFGGLSVEDAAEVMQLSPTTVKREWATARAWLFREIQAPLAF